MSQSLRNTKKITQKTVNRLTAFYKLARRNDYSVEESEQLAVYALERIRQAGGFLYEMVTRIEKKISYRGKETAETYDRLVAGREATEEINLWYIDGVLVNEQIVMRPETQTIRQINTEPNSEVKRICIERFGWPRYLRESKAKVIDIRDNDIDSTKESLMETHDKVRVLVCACPSTARIYTMRVPSEISTCESAQKYLHGNRSVRVIGTF